ncbi:hypothetical protein HMI48_04910 [Acidithiobacillus ferrooxidans]|jgi:hypothetical protein|uniref:hypothetical protein n=1 Tax=Acidithiobacillus ferrooxidans TaxID=920 RepID=UPI001C07EB41|nr:hypothetical protein [Acidithiobacillus ferrooxidans]MBU2773264.1 hypothetical protein [Acidithiobacillus ferrooxidans]
MTNVHPFPKHPVPKKARPNPPAAAGSEFIVQGLDGASADVLLMIIHAGSMYLTTPDEQPDDDLPTSQLLRTIAGLDAMTDTANILVVHARQHPEGFDQDAIDQLVRQGNQANKVVRKLYDMVPSDDFIMSMDSYGPDLLAEYATNAALVVTTSFALDILACYYVPFIKTGTDKRKAMFRDFQAAFQEASDECSSQLEEHEFLIKELASANRAMQKVMSEL